VSRPHHRSLWRVTGEADPPADRVLDALGAAGHRRTHHFTPQGSSALSVGDTLTIAVHTWPEHGLATLDTYGDPPADLVARLAAIGWHPHPEARRC